MAAASDSGAWARHKAGVEEQQTRSEFLVTGLFLNGIGKRILKLFYIYYRI